jgi:streptogramin lyase
MKGVVQSGGTASLHIVESIRPLSGVQVRLYAVSNGTSVFLGSATTDSRGEFTINTTAATADLFYAVASVSGGVSMMAIIGREMLPSITINELTTVAAVYCAARFLSNGAIGGSGLALKIVAAMNANVVDVTSGDSSNVLLTSPNADETNALRSTRSLANFLAMVVRDPTDTLDSFFNLTTPPDGLKPADTIAGMQNIALYPANHVGSIFIESEAVDVYEPRLDHQPDAWTLVVKVNDSGDDAHMFGGPGNLSFDDDGRVWIANNVIQGTGTATQWSIVLEVDGRPAPMSPFTGGGLLGPGFGVEVDRKGRVWFGDFGWGGTNPIGSMSAFRSSDAVPVSPAPNGYVEGPVHRVQQVTVDDDDNVWCASWGNGRVVVYDDGDASKHAAYPTDADPRGDFSPFGIAIAANGSAWVTNNNNAALGILHLKYANGALTLAGEYAIGKTLKGIAVDRQNDIVWVSSGGDDHVYAFRQDGTFIGGYQGGGIHGPWGIALDGANNLWVGNFGPLEPGSVFHGRLTQLAGGSSSRPLGDALTPQTGYTLPTAGQPVMLHNGEPLYGEGAPPTYIPMMRTTGLRVDAAGNVWTCNNWKPSFDVDAAGNPLEGKPSNPGGDGMLIWIGVATPVK